MHKHLKIRITKKFSTCFMNKVIQAALWRPRLTLNKPRRKSGQSPTQRTLKEMRKRGYLCEITERFNPWSKTRHDLFGFVDVLCLKGDELVAVQTTSGSNVSARIQKIKQTQAAALWLESPSRKIVVHGWRRVGPRGKRKLWQCREIPVNLA